MGTCSMMARVGAMTASLLLGLVIVTSLIEVIKWFNKIIYLNEKGRYFEYT